MATQTRRDNVTSADFVTAWQRSNSANECGAVFGQTGGWANGRARKLRALGVKIKTMPRSAGGGAKLDLELLQALADDALDADDESADE